MATYAASNCLIHSFHVYQNCKRSFNNVIPAFTFQSSGFVLPSTSSSLPRNSFLPSSPAARRLPHWAQCHALRSSWAVAAICHPLPSGNMPLHRFILFERFRACASPRHSASQWGPSSWGCRSLSSSASRRARCSSWRQPAGGSPSNGFSSSACGAKAGASRPGQQHEQGRLQAVNEMDEQEQWPRLHCSPAAGTVTRVCNESLWWEERGTGGAGNGCYMKTCDRSTPRRVRRSRKAR